MLFAIFRELGDTAEECLTVRGNQLVLTDIKDCKCNMIADNRKRRRLFTLDHIFVKHPNSDENELQQEDAPGLLPRVCTVSHFYYSKYTNTQPMKSNFEMCYFAVHFSGFD
ncbi:hypothetical protein EG68_03299 [Paragonimus skrjabini miyazakii]|uniref:Uncharacterized protein n=1 Tax=Paragonimus skrjabini miyazakii TaxID=59628 RepID=A0A8S9Z178_9TREM|nr:hypothetical protein EG68_03299 [Paragonimus skrjabini miyazakii]